jgi:ATP-binding cassette subfamily C protein CydC
MDTGVARGHVYGLIGGADALSAGQRRRLLLARALIGSSPIILLDEPTENLDANYSDTLLQALLTGGGGLFDRSRTVVVTTHHLPVAADCERLEAGVAGVAAMVERTSA